MFLSISVIIVFVCTLCFVVCYALFGVTLFSVRVVVSVCYVLLFGSCVRMTSVFYTLVLSSVYLFYLSVLSVIVFCFLSCVVLVSWSCWLFLLLLV